MLALDIACLSILYAIIFLITTNPSEEVMKKLIKSDYEKSCLSTSIYVPTRPSTPALQFITLRA